MFYALKSTGALTSSAKCVNCCTEVNKTRPLRGWSVFIIKRESESPRMGEEFCHLT